MLDVKNKQMATMSMNTAKQDEIRKILLSLLLARPGATSVSVLDRDYYEMEGEHIPWRKFGYTNIVEFLNSMSQYFDIEYKNDNYYVRGIPSEKSKHVRSLVERQKKEPKGRFNTSHFPQSHRPPSSYPKPLMSLMPLMPLMRQRFRIPAHALHHVIEHVNNCPNGVSIQYILQMIQQKLPYITLSMQDLRSQLQELSHQLYVDGETIYPVLTNNRLQNRLQKARNDKQPSISMPQLQNSPRPPLLSGENICIAGEEGSECKEDFDDVNDIMLDYEDSAKQTRTSGRIMTNFIHDADCEQNMMFNYDENDVDINEFMHDRNNMESNNNNNMDNNYIDISSLISNRTKLRLEQLVRKHPEGIWCAELPDKFLKEYNVRLNYIELGFTSVREYVSYLPDVFYMTRKNITDDFLLYSADKRSTIPDQETSEIKDLHVEDSHEQYDPYNSMSVRLDESKPIPMDISSSITERFLPDDVMKYNDTVKEILVTELQRDRTYLEIYIVEVFNPSFFWIHLRENKKRFDAFMNELHTYYQYNSKSYTIPKVTLQKGLHCASIYAGKWHRGIIKNVKPDFRVTILFYDYGTLKTYAPEDVYYLHKMFSSLSAQAIPCGLCKVRPCVGDRWKRSATNQFIDRVSGNLLAATIISVDPSYNSMMVVLTDTSEEEDVHINDWLVKEKLARCGEMVRNNFSYLHYLGYNDVTTQLFESNEISDTESLVSKIQYDKDQPNLHDEKAHRLSDVNSENNDNKSVEALRNVSSRRKAFLQKLDSINSQNAKSQSRSCSEDEEPKGPKELVALLKKFTAFNDTSDSISYVSTPETNEYFQNDMQQINSLKVDVQSQANNENSNYCQMKKEFNLRDSDNEEDNKKDFGTFKSLYGGHGLMEPCDWSIRNENDRPPCQTSATSHKNLDILIKECKSDAVEDKLESHNQRNELANPYFLNMTRKNEEYYSPEMNINYDAKNVSQAVARLRNRMEVYNNKDTKVIVPKNILEMLHKGIQSQDTPNSDTNVMINSAALSGKMTAQENVNENDEVYETKANQKIEKKEDSNAHLTSVFANTTDNKGNENKETSGCNTNSPSGSNTIDKMYSSKHKSLMDQMRHVQMNSIDSNSTKERKSSSSEQIQSFCNRSNINTMISSDNEQHETFSQKSVKSRFNKLYKFMESSSTFSGNSKSDSNLETRALLPSENCLNVSSNLDNLKQHQPSHQSTENHLNVDNSKQHQPNQFVKNDSIALSDVEDLKQHQPNQFVKNDSIALSNVEDLKQHQPNQFVKNDSIALSDVEDLKQHQPNQSSENNSEQQQSNAIVETSRVSRMQLMQLMLKTMQNMTNDSDLDSDDVSNQENTKSEKSEESDNTENEDDEKDDNKEDEDELIESIDNTLCKSINDADTSEIAVFNDCDLESDDDTWDCFWDEKPFPQILNYMKAANLIN